MVKILKIFFVCICMPLFLLSQSEEKPKYAPGKEKHRNKTDELGQKQGVWKFYNESGELTQEIEYVDDVRHGLSKKYYPFNKVMEEIRIPKRY